MLTQQYMPSSATVAIGDVFFLFLPGLRQKRKLRQSGFLDVALLYTTSPNKAGVVPKMSPFSYARSWTERERERERERGGG